MGGGDRIRKNSAVNMMNGVPGGLGPNGMRPRANTMSQIDLMHLDQYRQGRYDVVHSWHDILDGIAEDLVHCAIRRANGLGG